jgi:phytoene dehydrogenase-like protein
VILGAGVAGLVSAKLVLEGGATSVAVVDSYGQPGGNHISIDIGAYTFDIGAIVFEPWSALFEYFPAARAVCVEVPFTPAKVTPAHTVCTYPFSVRDDVLRAGPLEMLRFGVSCLAGRLSVRRIETTRDYAVHWLGDRFFRRSGLANFIQRFHGMPAEDLDAAFAEKRMRWIARSASLSGVAARLSGRGPRPPHRNGLVRPPCGFRGLYASVQQSLEAGGAQFMLGVAITRIKRIGDVFEVTVGSQTIFARRIISTIPIERALVACGLPLAQRLPSLSLVSLFFIFKGERGFTSSILYNFGMTGRWKRVTMFSDSYGHRDGREYFTVEVNMATTDDNAIAEAGKDFVADVAAKGLFRGELRLEGVHCLQNAYPSYPRGSAVLVDSALAQLSSLGIEAAGRQGTFDYLPSAHVVAAAVALRLGGTPQPPPTR